MFKIISLYAKRSKCSNTHPFEKLLISILPIIIVGYANNFVIPLINILFFIALHFITQNPMKLVAKYIMGIVAFASISSITFIFDYGFYYCITIILKSISGGLALTYLSFTTPLDDMLYVFSKNKWLIDICDIVKSMERFLVLIEEEHKILIAAMESRGGFYGIKSKIRSLGKIGAILLINSLKHWEDIKVAIHSRCYRGCLNYAGKRFNKSALRIIGILQYNIILVLLCLMYK